MKINIVLFHPEIPQNTGNIMRTCVATNSTLHLIKPYGFDLSLSSKLFKRNSTNYSELVDLQEYDSFEDFCKGKDESNFYFLTRYGTHIYSDIDIVSGNEKDAEIYYIFGSESSGIDKEILEKYVNNTFRIPMSSTMRSINLSNCAALICYDGLRQLNFEGLEFSEPHKKNYLGENSGKY